MFTTPPPKRHMSSNKFARATDFRIESIKVDDHEIGGITFAIEIYENIFSLAITGSVLCVETSSNQFLKENGIEGNEEIDIHILCADEQRIQFQGYITRLLI